MYSRCIATPLAVYAGIKQRVHLKAEDNPILERYYITQSRNPAQVNMFPLNWELNTLQNLKKLNQFGNMCSIKNKYKIYNQHQKHAETHTIDCNIILAGYSYGQNQRGDLWGVLRSRPGPGCDCHDLEFVSRFVSCFEVLVSSVSLWLSALVLCDC